MVDENVLDSLSPKTTPLPSRWINLQKAYFPTKLMNTAHYVPSLPQPECKHLGIHTRVEQDDQLVTDNLQSPCHGYLILWQVMSLSQKNQINHLKS